LLQFNSAYQRAVQSCILNWDIAFTSIIVPAARTLMKNTTQKTDKVAIFYEQGNNFLSTSFPCVINSAFPQMDSFPSCHMYLGQGKKEPGILGQRFTPSAQTLDILSVCLNSTSSTESRQIVDVYLSGIGVHVTQISHRQLWLTLDPAQRI
jgi:hypothetical protein